MTRTIRLGGTSYDMAWAWAGPHDKNASNLILIAGGGGSGNTGIKNQVQVVKAKGKGDFELVTQFVTDHDGHQRFCCGICSGGWEGASIVGVALGTHCLVLSLRFDEAQNKASFTRLVEFAADFAENDAGVNCCCITTSSDIATGGEDGVVRFWRLSNQCASSSASAPTVSATFECRGHAAPIMALQRHPSEPWVCSASKDGTCKIWNSQTGLLLADILAVSDGGANGATGSTKSSSLTKMQCRGCCFSADGTHLYTIQCGRVGSTILIKYLLIKGVKIDAAPTMTAIAQKTVVANKNPSTRLVISDSGDCIAVGCSTGLVQVFDATTLAKLFSGACHDDQPVLGLAFAPQAFSEMERTRCLFVTCSVDNLFSHTSIYPPTSILLYLLILIVLIGILLIHWIR